MRMKLLVCIALLGAASAASLPVEGGGSIPVYGIVNTVIDEQLGEFRGQFKTQLATALEVEPKFADKLIGNLGFDEYRNHLSHISVKSLLDHPVIVLMRNDPEDPSLLSVYMVKEGLAHLADDPLALPILEALRTGDNVPVVFSPALLPGENILTGLHLDRSVSIISKTLNIPNFARLAISFSDITWLLVQPRSLIGDATEKGLNEIGALEVIGDVVVLVNDRSPVGDVSELRTVDVVKKFVPVRDGAVATTRQSFSFLNWPALNLPAISDVPAIVLNFPLNILQSLLDYLRDRPPVSVTPLIHIPTVKPTAPVTDKPAEGARPDKEPVESKPVEENPQVKAVADVRATESTL